MTEEAKLEVVFEAESAAVDVVFVHGLTGDAQETWSNGDPDGYWPRWLCEELEGISVYSLGYPASVLKRRARREMDMFERAGNVLERFAASGVGSRPIVFVAHSLGGLLTKILLRKSWVADEEAWRRVSESTKLVFFIATPHVGAGLASFAEVVPYTSKHTNLLANQVGLLGDLNEQYRAFANNRDDLVTVAYYEKHTTKGVLVVSKESADPGVAGAMPIAVDKDHISICKPLDAEDMVYLGVKRRVQKLAQLVGTQRPVARVAGLGQDYEERSDDDRRDLHQKLVDADREHEYGYANNAQNGFARRYTKTGLLTAAREDHDNLLSEVETRFVLHVYHPLICRSAPEEEVGAVLQERVIDALAGKSIGGTRFDAKAVLSALYYLTEQCYIRWDLPK